MGVYLEVLISAHVLTGLSILEVLPNLLNAFFHLKQTNSRALTFPPAEIL
jgi:hypothetical protein